MTKTELKNLEDRVFGKVGKPNYFGEASAKPFNKDSFMKAAKVMQKLMKKRDEYNRPDQE